MLRDLEMERINQALEDLDNDYKSVVEQLRNEQDGPTRNKLDRQLTKIRQDIHANETARDQYSQELQEQFLRGMLMGLSDILKCHEAIAIDAIIASFRETLKTWNCLSNSSTNALDVIVNKLILIPQGQQPYSALDEFVSRLLERDINLEFHAALVTWKTTHKPKLDTGELLRTLENEISLRSYQYQPGLMIFIDRWGERSTQLKDDIYSVKAWLVEDIATYKTKPQHYHALPCPPDIETEGLLGENLGDRLIELIQDFLGKVGSIIPDCQNMAEIHVFLPTELLHLAIDQGKLGAGRRTSSLGHDYVVVVRCTERYARSYRKRPLWLNQWQQHQALLDQVAGDVFEPTAGVDAEDFEEVLEQAAESEGTIGLRLTEPVELEALAEVVDALLDTGLPSAIWSRARIDLVNNECPLGQVLSNCDLRSLPKAVQRKRKESRQKKNTPDCHIGHHLAFLCDDPHLVPPKSA